MTKNEPIGEIEAKLAQLDGDHWLKENFHLIQERQLALEEFLETAGVEAEIKEQLATQGWVLRVMISVYLDFALNVQKTEIALPAQHQLRNCIGNPGVSIGT